MRTPIGPTFDCNDITRVGTMVIYGVWANGKAPLNGGGAPGVNLGLYLGRTWQQEGYGWVAAPKRYDSESDSWSDEIDRSVRFFRARREACVFLWGYQQAHGRQAYERAMAEMPWARHAGKAEES